MILSLVAVSLAQEAPAAPSEENKPAAEAPKTEETVAVAEASPPRLAELSLSRRAIETGWTVEDGRGHAVDARTWAVLTGDARVREMIETQRRKGRRLGYGLLAGGGVVAASSAVPLLFLEDVLSTNESLPGFDEVGTRNDARVATAFALLGSGVILAGTGLVANAVADHRAMDLSLYMGPGGADTAIAAYNDRLGKVLTVVPVAEAQSDGLPEGGGVDEAPAENTAVPADALAVPAPTAEAKPAKAAEPAEAKPAEAKPAEAKPAEAKPAEAKPAEAKPAEAKPK